MIRAVQEQLRCPLCHGSLTPGAGVLRCPSEHAFDLARQGYANLLTGRAPTGVETPDMVAARASLLASGHLDPVVEAVATQASLRASEARPGLVVDAGAGTGYYLAAVLDRLPDHHGLALDISKAAVRRAVRAHPRAAAVVCDVWRGLPLADGCADLILDVFAPRNGAEFRRVLQPAGALLVVTPRPDHLTQLVGPLGLVRVDPGKDERLDRSLGGQFGLADEQTYEYQLSLSRAEVALFIVMGPNAWHSHPADLAQRLADWPEPVAVTASVRLRVYNRRDHGPTVAS